MEGETVPGDGGWGEGLINSARVLGHWRLVRELRTREGTHPTHPTHTLARTLMPTDQTQQRPVEGKSWNRSETSRVPTPTKDAHSTEWEPDWSKGSELSL